MSFFNCNLKAAKEKYRIPYGFRGQVFIFFDIKEGKPPKYENGFRIYEIPLNGIFTTQFKAQYGNRNNSEYSYEYVDKFGRIYVLDNFPQGLEPKTRIKYI